MKNNNTSTAANQLLKQYDTELAKLLLADLKQFKAKRKFIKPLPVSTATAA